MNKILKTVGLAALLYSSASSQDIATHAALQNRPADMSMTKIIFLNTKPIESTHIKIYMPVPRSEDSDMENSTYFGINLTDEINFLMGYYQAYSYYYDIFQDLKRSMTTYDFQLNDNLSGEIYFLQFTDIKKVKTYEFSLNITLTL